MMLVKLAYLPVMPLTWTLHLLLLHVKQADILHLSHVLSYVCIVAILIYPVAYLGTEVVRLCCLSDKTTFGEVMINQSNHALLVALTKSRTLYTSPTRKNTRTTDRDFPTRSAHVSL